MRFQIAIISNGEKAGQPICWTDETCSSRYGFGVLNVGAEDFGPADVIPGTDLPGRTGRTSGKICVDAVVMDRNHGFITTEQVDILRRFCSQWPDGPQIEN